MELVNADRSVSVDCYATLRSAFDICCPTVTESHVPSPVVFSYYRGGGDAILKFLPFLVSPHLRWMAVNIEAWHPSLLATVISVLSITVPVIRDIGIHGVAETGEIITALMFSLAARQNLRHFRCHGDGRTYGGLRFLAPSKQPTLSFAQ